jgi:metal-responsive CopG/Arc/MetJ family transcriptional regulator
MRETISISLPEEIKSELDEAVQEEGLSRSDLVRRALKDYLFIRRFRSLRARMITQAQARGLFTDDDVFEQVS